MLIYDTTLRDGSQGRDVNFTVQDKLSVLKLLDNAGVDFLELGWPSSNPKDMEAFQKAQVLKLSHLKISAFSSTRRARISTDSDQNLKAVLASGAKVACIFGKTWLLHVERQLNVSPEENLDIIFDSVSFLRSSGLTVFYDAEHFFDGYMHDREYAMKCLDAAFRAGAETAVLCDTNGGSLPWRVREIIMDAKRLFPNKELGIHCHNDSGCAVANSLICASMLSQIQGTFNGLGERCGNADLCQIIPALTFKMGLSLNFDLAKLKHTSDMIYMLANQKENQSQPYVGKNAFAHKAGVHADAVSKGASYEHVSPVTVGNERSIVLSELSGSANIVETLHSFGIEADKKDERVRYMLDEVKALELRGYNISDIESEKYLLANKHFWKKDPIQIREWRITTQMRNNQEYSECVIKGSVNAKESDIVVAVDSQGPVDAAFLAMRRLFAQKSEEIKSIQLVNYKVMIAEDRGAESSVRVFIEFENGKSRFSAIGVSKNIIEASLDAIAKGFKYYLLKNNLN